MNDYIIELPKSHTQFKISFNQRTLSAIAEAFCIYFSPYIYELKNDIEPQYSIIIDEGCATVYKNSGLLFAKNYDNWKEILSYTVRFIKDHTICFPNTYFLHASALKIHGRVCAFVGSSGTGKTTLTAFMIADERVSYITEDALIVKYNTLNVCPFPRPLLLRPSAIQLLSQSLGDEKILSQCIYNSTLDRHVLFHPQISLVESSPLSHIFYLKRVKGIQRPLLKSNSNCTNSLLENSLLPYQIRNNVLGANTLSRKCRNISIEYENLKDIKEFLFNYIENN